MSLDKDSPIFDQTSLADIIKKIYINSDDKSKTIDGILDKVSNLLKGVTDASMLLPLLKEILDVSVKNDEQLVKIAGIIQRLLQVEGRTGGAEGVLDLLPDHEKQQILAEHRNDVNTAEVDKQLKELDEKVKKAKEIIKIGDNKLLEKVAKDSEK